MNVRALILLPLLAGPAFAQGFAGLGASSEGYALPDPETRFQFPADHGQHPEFRIEWWYVTANLKGDDGDDYGLQWTLFRNALAPTGRDQDQAWMAHAAVSAPDGHRHDERLARGGIGQAGVTAEPFRAFIDEWAIEGSSLSGIRIYAQGADFAYDITASSDGPYVSQGANGYSVKSEAGQASHYYSQPFYGVEGTLTFPDRTVSVTGQAWLDREWSSAPLTTTQTGWDWISLHLNSGEKLMGYRLRDMSGSTYTVGTWIAPDGSPKPLKPGQLIMTAKETSEVAGRTIPTTLQVVLPDTNFDATVAAMYPNSWMDTLVPYWEGPVTVKGTHGGIGYLEMSGY